MDYLEAVTHLARHCWRGAHWEKRPAGPVCIKQPLRERHLAAHVDEGPAIGLAPIVPGTSVTQCAVLDFDSHKGEVAWPNMVGIAMSVRHELIAQGHMEPHPFRSSGGKGIHLVMLWEEPQDAYSVRTLLAKILENCNLQSGIKGVKDGQVEIFPKQDAVAPDGFGSMFVLPLSGESVPLDPVSFDPADRVESWSYSAPVPILERPPAAPRTEPRADTDDPSLRELERLLDAIPNRDADYDTWRNVIFAIHHATGGSEVGLSLAHAWSAKSSKYNPTFLDERVWPYIKDSRDKAITIDTLRMMAREHEDPADDFEAYDDPQPAHDQPTEAHGASKSPATGTGPDALRFPPIHQSLFVLRPKPEWIIPGIIPESDLMVMYGESGSGKSFFAFDLGATIACGGDWRGKLVRQGSVLYVCAEGAGGFRNRLRAFHQRHQGHDAMPFWIIDGRPNFMDKKDANEINKAALIVAHSDNGPVKLIIIDTLAQVMPGGNENTSEDMGKVLANCDALRRATHATVMLIHHSGKDLTKGARGWSGVKGAIGQEIEITRVNGARTATITKAKDGEDGAAYGFTLGSEGWEEKDGSVTTSCVVEIDERVQERSTSIQPYTGKSEDMAFAYAEARAVLAVDGPTGYTELLAQVRERRERKFGKDKKAVMDTMLKRLIAARHLSISDDGIVGLE